MKFNHIIKGFLASSIACGIALAIINTHVFALNNTGEHNDIFGQLNIMTDMQLNEEVPNKQYFFQYSKLPDPNSEYLDVIVQYIGEDNKYIKNMFYKCVISDDSTTPYIYEWQMLFPSALTYVTPEMFGAKADGVTNDADAFRKAFEVSSTVYLNDGKYYLGEEVIDLSNKLSIEIVGKNRLSTIVGGTFIVNIDSTWTRDNKGKTTTSNSYPIHISGVRFNRNHSDSPAIICACPVLIENCGIIYYHKFLAMPNTCYIDRINFLECNFYLGKEDYESGTLIVGCDGVGQYSDWNGHGDDWLFRNCSMTPIKTQVPLLHASAGNHSITFENCLNPCVCYGSDSLYNDLPSIYFENCHMENQYNPCFPKEGYINDKAVVNYTDCYFHSYVKFNADDGISGENYYISRSTEYSSDTDVGLLPIDLDKFDGVIIPNGSRFKHKKSSTTQYIIPKVREINLSSDKSPQRTRVSQVFGNMDYVFYYSDNTSTYDKSTKIIKENILPNNNDFNLWSIDISEGKNFFLHVFRRDRASGKVQKCVMYIGAYMYDDKQEVYRFQDGGNSIEGVYKWVDYNGAFPE